MRQNTAYSKQRDEDEDDDEIVPVRSHQDLWFQVELLIRQLNAGNHVPAGVKGQDEKEED